MNLRVGIVGLPNVGKSTLFNALTKQAVAARNVPFTTIDPNVGVVPVPDERLDVLAKISTSEKITPTTIEFVDIAGLVKNAHQGEGLGNKFLSHIREVDAIVHIVRFFEDPGITHVAGKIDPAGDIETIRTELALADLAHPNSPSLAKKPTLIVANMSEEQLSHANEIIKKHLPLDKGGIRGILPLCIKIEQELIELPDSERAAFLKEYGLPDTGLNRLIKESYKLLNLITFLTTGKTETRAWTVPKGALAPEAAGKIHSDMERGFIRAETISYDDLVAAGSPLRQGSAGQAYAAARAAGKVRDEGKDYVVQDGDVMIFKFAV